MFGLNRYLEIHSKKFELLFLFVLIVLSSFFRLYQLGYSDFYGDETKVLYLRKDVGAKDFLLNQRKGPMQYVTAWGTEKIFGAYSEFWTRLPFAVLGVLSVVVLYFLVREFYGKRVAAVASLLFSLNGFFIAFSRTLQYQSLLIFFGLLSVYSFVLFTKRGFKFSDRSLDRHLLLMVSGISLALAYLSHWDAVFYDLIVGVLLVKYLYELSPERKWSSIKDILIFLVIPFLLLLAFYFLPYFRDGYFVQYVQNYISRRVDGTDQLINNSSFTYWLYNSEIVFYLPFLLLPFIFKGYKKGIQFETLLLLLWFIVPFTLFQFFISNPGTHIQNYFIPLIVLSSLGMVYAHDSISMHGRILKDVYKSFWLLFFLVMAYTQLYAFVPGFNNGYPWKDSHRGPIVIEALEKTKNQYFIYGFPYNRGWREVRSYFEVNGMPRSFYTNDNVTIGEYYLYGVPAHKVHSQQMPQYYIYVQDNQEGNEISGNSWLQMYEEVGFNHPTTKILKLRDN